jgi:excisionase family DNA binding protein
MDALYTTHDISRLIQVDPSTVSKWIDRKLLVAFRTPGGHRRVRSSDLKNFLLEHQMPIPEELGGGVVRLLVVDEDKASVDAFKRALKPHASQVELLYTSSGVEAVLMVSEEKPHGMLVDLHMREVDGLDLCRRIRKHGSLDGVRLVTTANKVSSDLTEQSRKAGAETCLPKPLQVAEVLSLFNVAGLSTPAKRA